MYFTLFRLKYDKVEATQMEERDVGEMVSGFVEKMRQKQVSVAWSWEAQVAGTV